MTATDAAMWALLALLNLGLAALVLDARPRRVVHVLVAALVGTNGVYGVLKVFQQAGVPLWLADEGSTGFILNIPVFAGFLLLPLFFPRERVGPRGRRWALAAGLAFVLGNWAVAAVSIALEGAVGNSEKHTLVGPIAWVPFLVGIGAGAVLLLDGYLREANPARRTQVALVLGAYVLKAGNHWGGGRTLFGVLAPLHPEALAPLLSQGWWQALLVEAALFFGMAAVAVAILGSRLRARGTGARPLRDDLIVLLAMGAGLLLSLGVLGGESEYMILRPLLLTYGILHFELVPLDVERRRPLVAATVLAALGGLFLTTTTTLGRLGLTPDASTALGFLVAVALGGTLAWPLIRLALAPLAALSAERSRELYRAALEQAVADPSGHTTSNERVLRALRERLRISEREHAALEAEARALAGRRDGELAVGALFLGRYRVVEVLGEGGFARTLRARDERLGRDVVLKVAHWTTPEETRRALREGRILATLSHPHIVAVHDVEEVAGEVVLVLEHVPGGSLAEVLKRGPLPAPLALAVADDVLAALEAAHARGIVHRDVKPSNILLTAEGRAKLADFGIAAAGGAGTVSGTSFTKEGAGTLRYMAPEQARGLEAEPRSDLYAVGVVLYEMLAGKPYLQLEGLAEFEVRRAILEEEPRLPLRGVPAQVKEALRRALAKDPAERPASAAELRRLLAAESPKAPQI